MNAIAGPSAVPVAGPKLDNRRVLAGLIDLAVVAAGGAAILAAAGALGGGGSDASAPLAGVVLCWALYYHFACESGGGQTLGKRLLKIRVVRTDGTPAEIHEIAVRTVLRVVDMQFAYLVGLIVMLATGERRGRLGDLAAGTMIVSTAASTPASAPAPMTPVATPPTAAPEAPPEPEPAEEPVAPAFDSMPEVDEPELTVEPAEEPVAPAFDSMPEVDEPELTVEPAEEPLASAFDSLPEVDESEHTVKPVETVSAIDLVMGQEEPVEEPAADEPGEDARRE